VVYFLSQWERIKVRVMSIPSPIMLIQALTGAMIEEDVAFSTFERMPSP
jgi:hypothetical protein